MIAVVLAALLVAAPQAPAPTSQAPAATDSLVRVFVDCPNYVPGCDFDYLRTELTWVDYVRDRESADVHALATALETGGGGWEYTIALIGRGRWAGRVDTLRFTAPGTATYDEQRHGFAQNLSLALARYTIQTSAAPRLTISYRAPTAAAQRVAARTRDRWNFWVFQLRFNTNGYGQKCCHSAYQSGNVSADRTTPQWKFRMSARYGESISRFTYPTPVYDSLGNLVFDTSGAVAYKDTTESSFNRDYNGSISLVRSLSQHWSARILGQLYSSTSDNIRHQIDVGPAIEYNFFPYSQSTRRQLTAQLGVGMRDNAYDTLTLYDKTHERRPTANVSLSLDITQPWGNGSISAGHTAFLDNRQLNNTYLSAYGNIRLIRGLSLNLYAFRANVRDQIYLRKQGSSAHDVLLQRRAVETNYRYSFSFGISYRFGSTNNNTVNPRFGGGGGMFFFN